LGLAYAVIVIPSNFILSYLFQKIYVIAGLVAHSDAGPAVVISFVLAGISALISSFCYGYSTLHIIYSFILSRIPLILIICSQSEFSARIPVSGSTYSFVYISLGEFAGWMYVLLPWFIQLINVVILRAGWISIIEYTIGAAIAKEIAELCFRIATV
jgi:APA family basic amino acid/polyamine antiporter